MRKSLLAVVALAMGFAASVANAQPVDVEYLQPAQVELMQLQAAEVADPLVSADRVVHLYAVRVTEVAVVGVIRTSAKLRPDKFANLIGFTASAINEPARLIDEVGWVNEYSM